jgi:hypothetical protein
MVMRAPARGTTTRKLRSGVAIAVPLCRSFFTNRGGASYGVQEASVRSSRPSPGCPHPRAPTTCAVRRGPGAPLKPHVPVAGGQHAQSNTPTPCSTSC